MMRKNGLIFLFVVSTMMSAHAAPHVMTTQGEIEGLHKNAVDLFLGIPFAKPPVGELRWRPPQAPASWKGVRSAKQFGPTCAQITTLGPFAGPPNSNEDCLYLNVFTPDTRAKLPVLVWIYGGGYVDGESNDYDGSKLAVQGHLVVVTLNYRLNLFGFLAHPALDKEGHDFANYGVMDQQAALKWVIRNIAGFGGDPDNITLGGQSAGAGATAASVISPEAKGLFERAILESGGYTPFAPLDFAEDKGAKFARAAGCTEKAAKAMARCLRALPAKRILALSGTPSANGPFIVGPIVDGTVIPRQTIDAVRSGQFNRVPIMMGTTQDEGNFTIGITQYFKSPRSPVTDKEFHRYVAKTFGGNAGPAMSPPAFPKGTVEAVLRHYPIEQGAQPAWTRVATDVVACRGQYMAQAFARFVPVYMYEFDDRTAPSYFPKMPGYRSLAYHTADLAYLFAGYHGGPKGLRIQLDDSQMQLSNKLVAAWSNFAAAANPDGNGDTPWPRWPNNENSPAYFLQDDAWSHTQSNAEFSHDHQCGFWQHLLRYE